LPTHQSTQFQVKNPRELFSRLDSRTLHPRQRTGPLSLLYSNNIKNGINDSRDIKHRMACHWNLGWGSSKVIENNAIRDHYTTSISMQLQP